MSILTFYIGHIMSWNIAQAKQQVSEVVRLSAREPQAIYNRDKPVAVLINADEFEAFRRWRAGQHEPTLAAQFQNLGWPCSKRVPMPCRSPRVQRSSARMPLCRCWRQSNCPSPQPPTESLSCNWWTPTS